ncbi:hypothetical protein [Roseibium sp.]|uniref:hypothetical protein n=1 Tax=Roseibium sp. TaxID=1936156 RepID=UPI003265A18A
MSIQLELKVTAGRPVYRGHDHYWSVIRDLGKDGAAFTFAEIAGRCNDPKDDCITDFLRRLVKAGFVKVTSTRRITTNVGSTTDQRTYELIKRPSATPILNRDGRAGKQGLGQVQLWNAIRAMARFDATELAIAASTDEVSIERQSALAYCRHLEKAGYLQIIRKGSGRVSRVWRLRPKLNTGPKPPMILRTKMVWDQNRAEIIGTPVAEVAA